MKIRPIPFSYWYFYKLFRDEQNRIKWINQIRKEIKNNTKLISIIAFFSIFNNFILYFLLVILGTIGFIEIMLILFAFLKGNIRFFKRKIRRESIWK